MISFYNKVLDKIRNLMYFLEKKITERLCYLEFRRKHIF